MERDSDKLFDPDWSNNEKHVNWFPYRSVILKNESTGYWEVCHDSIKATLTTLNGGKVDDPARILKPSPAHGLQHLVCFSTDSFQNYFCHMDLHISGQMNFPDLTMPLCNHSFHNAMPQEACPSGFLYLGIQVTWAYWYWKENKKTTSQFSKKPKSKVFWLKTLKMSYLWKKTNMCHITVPSSIQIYCRT